MKRIHIVIQESSRRRLETKPDTKKAKFLATKETLAVEEERSRGRNRKISAVPSTEATDMYLVLPSCNEQYKAEIKKIIAKEKSKLCGKSFFKKDF